MQVLKTMDLDTSIDGTRVVVRWQPLNDSVGPRKVPVLAIEHVPAVIEQQLELLGTVGPAHLFYHVRGAIMIIPWQACSVALLCLPLALLLSLALPTPCILAPPHPSDAAPHALPHGPWP